MKFIEYSQKLEAIKEMSLHYRTGTPCRLASSMNVSERTVQRMVHQLRKQGYPITFNRLRNSYVLKE